MRLAVALVCLAGCSAPPRAPARAIDGGPPVSSAPVIFEYSNDASLGYALLVHADGVWERFDHAGHAPPTGRLGDTGMRTFERALRAAKFHRTKTVCANARAMFTETYVSPTRRKKVAVTRCQHEPDAATRLLRGCLERLTHGNDVCDAADD
jgi:hypothetical protein